MSDWLQNLKAGDKAIAPAGGLSSALRIVKVDRTTATQIIVGPSRYSRRNGYLIGSDRWSRDQIYEPTPALIARARRDMAYSRLRSIMHSGIDDGVPTENIEQAVKLLKATD